MLEFWPLAISIALYWEKLSHKWNVLIFFPYFDAESPTNNQDML